MNYLNIAGEEATLSPEMSQRAFGEIVAGPWRCYASAIGAYDDWINRYLSAHARVPGIVTDDMPSATPVYVLRWWRQAPPPGMAEGIVYRNGAVITIYTQGQAALKLLFVAEADATGWRYPEEGYLVFSDLIATYQESTHE